MRSSTKKTAPLRSQHIGICKKYYVAAGDPVTKKQMLCVIESDSYEVYVKSPFSGIIESLGATENDEIRVNDLLVTISYHEEVSKEKSCSCVYFYDVGTTRRPAPENRLFKSTAVEEYMETIASTITNPYLEWLFRNCFPNTLDTTVYFSDKDRPETHIITGDINAMWLRDSTCQVWPYLDCMNDDPTLQRMIQGVINRQVDLVLIDPYANAFKKDKSEPFSKWAEGDITIMNEYLHERKWEINSLLFVIRLSYEYWKKTEDVTPFDKTWVQAMKLLFHTLKDQQRLTSEGPYFFQRLTLDPADAVANGGFGQPTRKNGMIHGIFRQDDATILSLFVPDNIMAITELRKLGEMMMCICSDEDMSKDCYDMAEQVEKAVYEDAIVEHKIFGKIFAFEIDGFGSRIVMDDPSLPGLLNLPSMGYWGFDEVYENTRKFILSDWNPMYEKGKAGDGFGSAHYPKGRIWPMGTISRALTSQSKEEIQFCLNQLVKNHSHSGLIHETYSKDDSTDITREWFSWVNSYFGELIVYLYKKYPELL